MYVLSNSIKKIVNNKSLPFSNNGSTPLVSHVTFSVIWKFYATTHIRNLKKNGFIYRFPKYRYISISVSIRDIDIDMPVNSL